MNDVKPGYQSSEFWLTLAPWVLAGLVLGLNAAGVLDAELVKWILAYLGVGGSVGNAAYSMSRGNVKANGN